MWLAWLLRCLCQLKIAACVCICYDEHLWRGLHIPVAEAFPLVASAWESLTSCEKHAQVTTGDESMWLASEAASITHLDVEPLTASVRVADEGLLRDIAR